VALIVVLWIFIFLFVVAFEFSTAAREEADAAHRFSEETAGYYLAVAGFERGLYDLLKRQRNVSGQSIKQTDDPFDGAWREERLGSGVLRVRLIDEGGKININRVNEGTLRRIFTNLGFEGVRRDTLVDSILDWRDEDSLHRANGAESDYYQALPSGYTARNGPLDTIADLLWIRGVGRELFFGSFGKVEGPSEPQAAIALRELFTVDSPTDRVNLRTADAPVIHALTGISLERCRAFVEERRKLSDKTVNDLLPLLGLSSGDTLLQSFVFTNPSVIAVEAEGRPAESRAARRVTGIVRLGGAPGFQLMRWLEVTIRPVQTPPFIQLRTSSIHDWFTSHKRPVARGLSHQRGAVHHGGPDPHGAPAKKLPHRFGAWSGKSRDRGERQPPGAF
jgi:general secretion pathway protein K